MNATKEKISNLKSEIDNVISELFIKYKRVQTLYKLYKKDMETYELKGEMCYEMTYYNEKHNQIYPIKTINVTADDIKKVLLEAENDNYALILIDGYENFRKGIDKLKKDKKLLKFFPNIPKDNEGKIYRLDFITYFLNDEISNNINFTNAIINYIVLEEFRHNSVHNKREMSPSNKKKIIDSINNFFNTHNYKKTKLADLIIQALQNKNLLAINLIKDNHNDNVADYLVRLLLIFTKLCDNLCCKLDELDQNNS